MCFAQIFNDEEELIIMMHFLLSLQMQEEFFDKNVDQLEGWSHVRLFWEKHVRKLNHEKMFESNYRMSEKAFNKLVKLLKPHLIHTGHKSRVSQPVYAELMVALTIRYFAGAQYPDLCDRYTINRSWMYKVRDKVMYAILSCKELDIVFPTEKEDIEQIREDFAAHSKENVMK